VTKIVAVANQKGGVGKTTTAVNLAAWFAESGVDVLLLDLDPQGNLTSSLGVDRGALKYSTYELLVGEVSVPEATLPEVRPGLDLIAARRELAGAEVELAPGSGWSLRRRPDRLPALAWAADDQRPERRRRGHHSHSVRVPCP
jgi:chromosome partitioning protein